MATCNSPIIPRKDMRKNHMKTRKNAADKIAEKAVASPAFQQSWQVHMKAFGPLLESAFTDNAPARVHLCNALNHLSRRDVRRADELLDQITSVAETDADRAAVCFFRGLSFETVGNSNLATKCYRSTVAYNDRFYLPYFKLARAAHVAAAFDEAAEHYRNAIRCLMHSGANEQTRAQIAALRTNLASALTMMHDYEAAAAELASAKGELPEQPGREATEAILAAAMGERYRVETLIRTLFATVPQAVPETRRMTDEILVGEHPHFSPVTVDPAALDAFWTWCASVEMTVKGLLDMGDVEGVKRLIGERLAPLSPYCKRSVKLELIPEGDPNWTLRLGDYYMVALRTLYEELIARRPDGVLPMLSWEIGH